MPYTSRFVLSKSRYLSVACIIIFTTLLVYGEGQQAALLPDIANVRRLSERVISGATPEGPSAFAALYAAGVRVIVSVDGMSPDVDTAAKHQLRYVHIPIGYDGISEHAVLSLVRVVREAKGRIFIHCHHGVHRGPAAAAIAWRADTGVSAEAAAKVLEAAGTGSEYTGLWDAVRRFQQPGVNCRLPDLQSRAPVTPLTENMARIGHRFSRLESGALDDESAVRYAVLLRQDFRELMRSDAADRHEQWRDSASETEEVCERIVDALRSENADQAAFALRALKKQCVTCHEQYR